MGAGVAVIVDLQLPMQSVHITMMLWVQMSIWARCTDLHNITETLLKSALNTIKQGNKNKDWYAQNQNNVSEWRDMSSRGLLFQ